MGGVRTYLDYNATAPLRPEARAAMIDAFDAVGNPSSIHAEGRVARGRIEEAREAVAALCGASSRDVVFTSGATEANATALTLGIKTEGDPRPFTHLLISAVEHPSGLEGARVPNEMRRLLPVDDHGLLNHAILHEELNKISVFGGRSLVSVQAANSETGVIQPIPMISQIVHAHGGLLHCDAVQAAGRLPLDQVAAGADILTLSAHKIGGPQGVGALVFKSGGISLQDRLIRGGGQEKGARAGTEGTALIAGFGAACAAAQATLESEALRLTALRDEAEAGILKFVPNAVIFGKGVRRLPNTLAFSIPGLSAETALMAFDLAGLALSSGSACSSGKVKRSHVLDAMSVASDIAKGALRLSFGYSSTNDDVIRFLSTCEDIVRKMKTRTRAA